MQPLDSLSQFLWCLSGNKLLQYMLYVCVMGLGLEEAWFCLGFYRTCFIDLSVAEIDVIVLLISFWKIRQKFLCTKHISSYRDKEMSIIFSIINSSFILTMNMNLIQGEGIKGITRAYFSFPLLAFLVIFTMENVFL